MKQCGACGETKTLSLFHKNPACRDGRASRCKACAHADLKQKRTDPVAKERFKLYGWRSNLRKRYGIDERQYLAILATQGGGCAICGAAVASTQQRRLHVDHDHDTGEVRGLLCSNCNNGIGRFLERPDLLRGAALYLEANDGKKLSVA